MSDETMSVEPMTCGAVEERLEAYLGDNLEAADESRVARHLMVCPRCAAEVGLAERVEHELAELPVFDAPPELIARIKNATRYQPAPVVALASRRPRRFLRPTVPRPVSLAAALLAALAIGWWQADWRQAGGVEQPSVAEIAAAEREARYALALVARIGRKASAEVRDEVLIERVAAPVLRSVGRSFEGPPDRDAAKTGGLKS